RSDATTRRPRKAHGARHPKRHSRRDGLLSGRYARQPRRVLGNEEGVELVAMRDPLWRLVDFASRALEPEEREAVRGDLAESGDGPFQALSHVLGLLARREAASWSNWRAWMVFLILIVPTALLLSLLTDRVATEAAIYCWSYFNNWDLGLLHYRAF